VETVVVVAVAAVMTVVDASSVGTIEELALMVSLISQSRLVRRRALPWSDFPEGI
jgi:hypothetical protein